MNKLWRLLKNSSDPIGDIMAYIQGNYRYKLYYKKSKLVRGHIREQIDYRISIMNKECYNTGSCVKCGCLTTSLQMANKPCKGYEYPPIVDKESWARYKRGALTIVYGKYKWMIDEVQGTTICYEENIYGYKILLETKPDIHAI